MILPINIDSTATGKKIDIETNTPTIFTLNQKSNIARCDGVFMFLYQENKELKNLLKVKSEQKQYTNLIISSINYR